MNKSISFIPTEESLININNTINKYKFNRSEALNYICSCHDINDKNLNNWYRQLLFNFQCEMTNAANIARTSGDFSKIDEVMEGFKCQIL